jgi:alkanesulfonate monooxygenase SsuD/methylene tetrahydromethanopterin reductase-like flavin-dependent oxidoreductase (luciferase family)
MVEFANALRSLVRGDKVTYDEEETQIPWADGYELPIWIAAYGPKALKAAGEAGDGLVLQIGEPALVKWFADQAISAGKAAGRDMSKYQIMSAAPVWVGDMDKGREQTRWFPGMVGNHVADIVEKYGMDDPTIPHSFTEYIKGRKGYDYKDHANKDAEHVAKLKELEAAGVTQFNIYLMCGEEERIVAEYAEHVIPHFR